MTFYLKYRPKNIEELDLGDVREQLLKIVKTTEAPHAYLFAGPRGAGKTSAARILAKAVNCEKPAKNGEPCNECSQCEQINKGASLDIIELDAASHRGVEDMRSLRDAVSLVPASAKNKVYIIDEAHMLTTEAANSLLKTLEEPPSHVIFVLATTAPEKLLDTIKSRCLTLVFRKAGVEEVTKSLQKIVVGEKLEVEKGVLEEIAKRVDGSFREAHKVLEQLVLGKKKVDLKDIDKSRVFSSSTVEEFIGFLAGKDTKGALQLLLKANEDGVNMKSFSTEVVTELREALLSKLGVLKGKTDIDLDIESLQTLAEVFSEASGKVNLSVIPSLPLELAVVRWGENVGVGSHSTRLSGNSGNDQDQPKSTRLTHNSPVTKGDTGSPSSRSWDKSTLDSASSNLAQTNESGIRERSPSLERGNKRGKVETLPQILDEKWKEILAILKPKNFSIEALLRAARPAGFDGKTLSVEVFYGFHKERLEKDQYRKLVEEVAGEIFGATDVRLVCLLSSTPRKALDYANVADSKDDNILEVAEKIFGGEETPAENLPN